MILGPISYFPIYFYIGYKGISVYGKLLSRSNEIPWSEVPLYVERRVQGIRYEVRSNVVDPNHGCTKKRQQ